MRSMIGIAVVLALGVSPARAQVIIDENDDTWQWWTPDSISGGTFLVPFGRIRGYAISGSKSKGDVIAGIYDITPLELRLRLWGFPWLGVELGGGTVVPIMRYRAAQSGIFGGAALKFRLADTGALSAPELTGGYEKTSYLAIENEASRITEWFGRFTWGFWDWLRASADIRQAAIDFDSEEVETTLVGGRVNISWADPKHRDRGFHLIGEYAQSLDGTTTGADRVDRWSIALRYRQSLRAQGGWLQVLLESDPERRPPETSFQLAPARARHYSIQTATTDLSFWSFALVRPAWRTWLEHFERLGIEIAAAVLAEPGLDADKAYQSRLVTLQIEPSVLLRWSRDKDFSPLYLQIGIEIPLSLSGDRVGEPNYVPEEGKKEKPDTFAVRQMEPFAGLWAHTTEWLDMGILSRLAMFRMFRAYQDVPANEWGWQDNRNLQVGLGLRVNYCSSSRRWCLSPSMSYLVGVAVLGTQTERESRNDFDTEKAAYHQLSFGLSIGYAVDRTPELELAHTAMSAHSLAEL